MPRARILMTLLCGLTLAGAPAASAADFAVTTTADGGDSSPEDGLCKAGSGQCTLRAALGQAAFSPGADRVIVPAGTFQLVDGLSALAVTSSVTIEGAGARATIIKASAASRVMLATANLVLRDVALTGAAPTSGSSIRGGALAVTAGDATLERVWIYGNTIASATNAGGAGVGVTGGSLTILDSTISGNTAYGRIEGSSGGSASGGGVVIGAPTVIRRSTISGNQTQSLGAGQFSSGGGISAGDETTLEHVTLVGNTAATYADSSGFRQGGNIYVQGTGLRSIAGSIIAGGTANSGSNCYIASGAVTEPAKNITSNADCLGGASVKNANLQLGVLANHGGPTDTVLPAVASPAVNAAANCGTRVKDQRGGALPAGPACDLGALEIGADRRVTLQASKSAPAAGDDVTLVASITNDGPDATTGEAFTIELPAGTTATTATPTTGSCAVGAAVTCAIGTLANGANVTVVATVRASGVAGTLTARRAGPLPDTTAANDAASVSFAAGPVAPAGGGGTSGGAGSGNTEVTGQPGVVAPVVTGLRLKAKPTLRKGARLTFTVSQGASVKIVTERLLSGRVSAGKCKTKAKRGKRCKLPKVADTRTQTFPAGAAQLTIPAKRLRVGNIRFTVVATSTSGGVSAPATLEAAVKRR